MCAGIVRAFAMFRLVRSLHIMYKVPQNPIAKPQTGGTLYAKIMLPRGPAGTGIDHGGRFPLSSSAGVVDREPGQERSLGTGEFFSARWSQSHAGGVEVAIGA